MAQQTITFKKVKIWPSEALHTIMGGRTRIEKQKTGHFHGKKRTEKGKKSLPEAASG